MLVGTGYLRAGAVVEALRREVDGWARVVRTPFESAGADVREL